MHGLAEPLLRIDLDGQMPWPHPLAKRLSLFVFGNLFGEVFIGAFDQQHTACVFQGASLPGGDGEKAFDGFRQALPVACRQEVAQFGNPLSALDGLQDFATVQPP